jgi:ribonuclease P protein component
MLPRENRLSADFDYRRLRRDGQRYGSSSFTLFVLPDQKKMIRFGFVVSTRVSKLATKRNRIKRLLREEVGSLFARIQPGTLAAFWVRERALSAAPAELRREVREALTKAKVYY